MRKGGEGGGGRWREGRRGVDNEGGVPNETDPGECFKSAKYQTGAVSRTKTDVCAPRHVCSRLRHFLSASIPEKATNTSPAQTAQRSCKNATPALLICTFRFEIAAPATPFYSGPVCSINSIPDVCQRTPPLPYSCPPSSLPHLHILAPHASRVQSCVADGDFLLPMRTCGDRFFVM